MEPSLIIGVFAAGVIALGGAFLSAWCRFPGGVNAATTLLAIAVGWIIGAGYHLPPMADANFWPSFLAQLAVLLALAVAGWRGRLEVERVALATALGAGGGSWLILNQLVTCPVSGHKNAVALGLGIGLLVISWVWERAGAALAPITSRIVLIILLIGLTITLAAGGSIRYGVQGAVLCAAVTAPLVLSFWRLPQLGVASGALTAATWLVVLPFALVDYTPSASVVLLPSMGLLAVGGAVGWLRLLPGLRTRPKLATAVVIGAAVVAAGLAVGWMLVYGQPTEKSAGDYSE